MPKPRKKNYYQAAGRPNLGLENPAKFGLTFEEVVELINNNEWPRFLRRWKEQQKKEKKLQSLNYICPKCQKELKDIEQWSASTCKECFIEQSRESGKKSVMYSHRKKCKNCSKATEGVYCSECQILYSQMMEKVNEA